jgi:hypothetical protein
MQTIAAKSRLLPVILSVWGGLFLFVDAQASEVQGKNGSVILRMCKSAESVKMLSVMCHGYLDGYLDASQHYGKGKAAFCLESDDRKKAPGVLVEWIEARPGSLNQPAAEVMHQALTAHFPCKGSK